MGIAKYSEINKINNDPMLSPESIHLIYDSIGDTNSGRTEDGVMHINYITPLIRKLEIKMPILTQDEISKLASTVQGKEYTIRYLDPIKGITESLVYTSNSDFDLGTYMYGGVWQGFSFSAIEVVGESGH